MPMTTDSSAQPSGAEARRDLRGSTSELSATDLFQVLEAGRRSGVVELSGSRGSATLWLRDGRLCDARSVDGERGVSVFFHVLEWDDADFRVQFVEVERPIAIAGTLSALLLEAARRRDELARFDAPPPPHAALTDPPPIPPREVRTAHRALTLMNVLAADAASVAQPSYLSTVLERSRSELEPRFTVLSSFRVSATAQVSLSELAEPESIVSATAAWLEAVRSRLESSFPGRFPRERLLRLTEAVRDDLAELGFLEALGARAASDEVPS